MSVRCELERITLHLEKRFSGCERKEEPNYGRAIRSALAKEKQSRPDWKERGQLQGNVRAFTISGWLSRTTAALCPSKLPFVCVFPF